MSYHKLNDEQIGNLSAHLAHEMGAAAGLYKIAEEIHAGMHPSVPPEWGRALVERLTPEHVALLQDLNPAR